MKELVAASGVKAANIRVLLTGHSLGGALAALAAHDLAMHCGLTNCQVADHPWMCTLLGLASRSDVRCLGIKKVASFMYTEYAKQRGIN